jgi:serine/threonine protein phosphatase PrpC
VSEGLLNEALSYAYDELDKKDNPLSQRKMGTTMACVVFHRGGVLAAHIGDSRIYHIRTSLANVENGLSGIVYQSADHSLVNDLIRAGELTEEEARNFTQKNVITRAMQPNLERRYKAEIYNIDDIQDGDFFFICCDGVLEQLSNEKLGSIMAEESLSDADKIAAIKSICDGKTKDNYSCWLIPVNEVIPESSDQKAGEEVIVTVSSSDTISTNTDKIGSVPNLIIDRQEPTNKKSSFRKWLISIFTFLCITAVILVVMFLRNPTENSQDADKMVDSINIAGLKNGKTDSIQQSAKSSQEANIEKKELPNKTDRSSEDKKGKRELIIKEVKTPEKVEAKPQETEKPEEVNSVKLDNSDKKKSMLINNSKSQDSPNGKQQ